MVNLFSNPFVITVIFIVVSTVVAAFIRRVRRDKCLKDFTGDMVTLEEVDGDLICGKLAVENTGLEFVYSVKQGDDVGFDKTNTNTVICRFCFVTMTTLVTKARRPEKKN